MMNMLLVAAAGLGAGWLLFRSRPQELKLELPGLPSTSALQKGRSYSLVLTVNPEKTETKDANLMSSVIKTTFQQMGFLPLANPVASNSSEMKNFVEGKPSTWVFQGTWTRDEKTVPQGPNWLGMVIAYEMPVR